MSSSATDRTQLVDVPMPAMGSSVVEGTLIAWNKAVGDAVALDEAICAISTDKIDADCPAPAAGVLAEVLVAEGETVDVGTVLARIATVASAPTVSEPVAGAPAIEVPASAEPRSRPARKARISPVVGRIAQAHGIDLAAVTGTGRDGRITKKDVLRHVEDGPEERPLHSESPYRPDAAPVAFGAAAAGALGGTEEPLSRMRRSIGRAMLRSQEVAATCHTMVECDMSRIDARRRELGTTALPLVARGVIDTLGEYPDLNATLDGDTLTRFTRVHLGIAVSLGADGLIVPVVHDAQELGPTELGQAIREKARRARGKQLTADDVAAATFTITNPGAAGALFATPIIHVPQVAILDLEAIVRRPVVVTDADGNESIAIRSMANLILGWDHRAIDGIYAAQFLTSLRRRLEAV